MDQFSILIEDAQHSFSGWDFSYIRDRFVEEPLTWSYTSKIIPYLRNSSIMLDMGTGGGEYLSSLMPLPKVTFATEAYSPNIPIAKDRLSPLGVKVEQIYDDLKLPFTDNYFDLVINRHEEYSIEELYRVIKKDGMFITQQVGNKDNFELNQLLEGKYGLDESENWNVESEARKFEQRGFKIIETHEGEYKTRVFDVGAIVYYLKAIPWQIEDFSVEKYKDNLLRIHKMIKKNNYIELTSNRFFLMVKK